MPFAKELPETDLLHLLCHESVSFTPLLSVLSVQLESFENSTHELDPVVVTELI